MYSKLGQEAFVQHLRQALADLYDPVALLRNPLVSLFGFDQKTDPALSLQNLILVAIEALKPSDGVPPTAPAWRLFHILFYRFAEGSTQQEVASDLALSTRHLRRLEVAAVRALADHLWAHYNSGERHQPPTMAAREAPLSELSNESGTRERELQWLKMTSTTEAVDIGESFRSVIATIDPLVRRLGVTVSCHTARGLPSVAAQATSLRQALLNLLTTAARAAGGGEVQVAVDSRPEAGVVLATVLARKGGIDSETANARDNVTTARELLELSSGSLLVTVDKDGPISFTASIELPATEQMPVLVIDDNADSLQLVERYLSGTRYRFVGTTDPLGAVTLAERSAPVAVLLDIMLPGTDGWDLLGRLREHPSTQRTPIIICTILPERDLALTLGAAEFMLKPVMRESLLAALDRLVLGRTGSH